MRKVFMIVVGVLMGVSALVTMPEPASAHETEIRTNYAVVSVNSSHDTLTACQLGYGYAHVQYYYSTGYYEFTVSNGCYVSPTPPGTYINYYQVCDLPGGICRSEQSP